MKKEILSRTDNTIKNIKYGMIGQVIQYGLSFVTRSFFIYFLSKEFLGMNSVISNILMVLSLAEAGLAGAFQVMLYKPMSEHDYDKVGVLIGYFKKLFLYISIIILIVGLLIIPIILEFIEMSNYDVFVTIYLLFLGSSFFNYLTMPYRTLIRADQKSYVISLIKQISVVLQYICQILVLLLFQDFVLYIIVQVGFNSLNFILPYFYSKKKYPIRSNTNIDEETKRDVKNKVKAGFYHHLGQVVYSGTDNLVIASQINLVMAGIFSNYILIVNIIRTLLQTFYHALFASIGNKIATDSNVENYSFFKKVFFMSMVLSGIASILLFLLLNPFINYWIGTEFILPNHTVFLIAIVFFVDYQSSRKSATMYKQSTGLFEKDKYFSLLEGSLNIIISLSLVKFLGLNGILLGSLFSHLLTSFWVQPLIIYKYYFNVPVVKYFVDFFRYLIIFLIIGSSAYFLNQLVYFQNDIMGLLATFVINIVYVSVLSLLFFYNTLEYKYFWNVFTNRYFRN